MTSSDENNGKKNKKRLSLKDRLYQRSDEARIVRRIVAVALIVITILIAIGANYGYSYIKTALEPVNKEDDSTISVEIPMGSSSSQIASILEENGIINNSIVYRFYIKFKNATEFQAGEYQLSPSMTLQEVTDSLQTGKILKEPVFSVTIPEGKTIEEIAGIYAEKANVDKDEFIETVENKEYIEELIAAYPTILSEEVLDPEIKTPLEGYLFAATYQFYEENPSIKSIVNSMLQKTEDVVTQYLGSVKEDWTIHEVITMASLVEKEARTEEERKVIAGVFYNRLAEDMMLQTDPTVAYAQGEHLERTLYEHLEIDSPYNTYQIVGLPIGPISNFGENSLVAVLEPEETEYMYFVAAPDGEIYYSSTYDEHQRLIDEHLDRD
ncbi:endolytic transglycosylase MltG [Aquibacillus halophilus]|uniref:Endolytic murein transglycosylase n=1 Tax=Aquibacillus halophilus TaxID=930132 RepID=A0A6A8DBW8_9BACI|nr:endolytic transglycosylase MltG [Aquibacillus halophilus]MRH43034.1 endolytic transglycosylase MltG [Aquibacillus halophilus]